MATFRKTYHGTTLTSHDLRAAIQTAATHHPGTPRILSSRIDVAGGQWTDLTVEEFLSAYDETDRRAELMLQFFVQSAYSVLRITRDDDSTSIQYGPSTQQEREALFGPIDLRYKQYASAERDSGLERVAPLKLYELDVMRLAISEARKCIGEDGRTHPKVGCVVVKDGRVLAHGFRGELAEGNHAEYTVLEKKLHSDILSGATLYTTLEPCTQRNPPKQPCATHIQRGQISRVVIGMLDPNQDITGKGVLSLRRSGIEVQLFPADLMKQLEELNRHFIALHGQ